MSKPKIYSTLIIIIKEEIEAEGIKRALSLKSDNDTLKKFFERNYEIAYNFFYNEFFKKKLKIEYLGSVCEEKLNEVGSCRLDFVLIKTNLLNVKSLHIHFNFLKLEFDWQSQDDSSIDDSSIKDLSRFFAKVYDTFDKVYDTFENKNDNVPIDSFSKLKKILVSKNKRRYTFPITRYMYVSVCNLNKDAIKKWDEFAVNIWKLLYFHPEGVDEDRAKEILDRDKWNSTNFFWNFYQPGAIVSLSTAYPNTIYSNNNIKWFLPNINNGNNCIIEIKNRPEKEKYISYDLLPEYPPLRYLGLLSLEFAGFVEEILRYLYEEMLILQKSRFKIIKSIFKLPKLETLYYNSKNLEYLRLPITREFVSKLISSKMQRDMDENIKELKANILNTMVLMLTIIALIIALIQVIPIIFK